MNFLKCFDHFIFDLDGVVYIGSKTVNQAPKVLDKLRKEHKTISFITNNPTRSPRQYVKKLKDMKIFTVEEEIITSPMAVAFYLKKRFRKLNEKTAYVIGSSYLKKVVKETGLTLINNIKALPADFVIMGGHDKFSYEEIYKATISIRKGAKFIATNRDSFYPSIHGFSPATGALLSSIEVSSSQKAITVGKPEKTIFDLVKSKSSLKKTLMIGDNLDTDILGGKNAGLKTALVFTGATLKKDLVKSDISPDYVIKDISFLLKQ